MKNNNVSLTIGNTPITFETGYIAKQANGSVILDMNGTVILATVCMTPKAEPEKDFFPLVVDYQERAYAAGKIPGGFFKKEGRPKDAETLTARVIDRTIRPLFPDGMRNGVQVICSVLSSDSKNDPDVQAVNAASAALVISDVPFNGPCGGVRVGMIDNEFIINPTYKQRAESVLDIIVCATKEKIMMLETKADQIPENIIIDGIKFGHEHVKKIIEAQEDLTRQCGRAKADLTYYLPDKNLLTAIKEKSGPVIEQIFNEPDKINKGKLRQDITDKMIEEFRDEENCVTENEIIKAFDKAEKIYIRDKILYSKVRPDGREQHEIRPIDCAVSFLPHTHGSSVFTRGQTQAIGVATLGMKNDTPMIEDLTGISFKKFFLHYAFPPYSVGEVSPLRGSSRREIGHGALAEKAVDVIIPDHDVFPYTIRVNSEITESNGSSSMASVCAATLALMDAGVPVKAPVAGIAMGVVTNDDDYLVLTDIQGAEDHCGDMDFKVAGSRNGITAIQLDMKIQGITYAIIEETLAAAKNARCFILDRIESTISSPREKVAACAPKITVLDIKNEKIGELIGPGGKNIKKITAATEVEIEIDDETNKVSIFTNNEEAMLKAVSMVRNIIDDLEIGRIYDAVVEKVTDFGAFCGVGQKSGLCHVSELSDSFVKNVSDIVKEGDNVKVKVIAIDAQGRIKFSIKQASE